MKALFLNCTLKKSPQTSNTRVLIDKAAALYAERGVNTKVLRMADYRIARGVSSDEGGDDEWPHILDALKEADIVIIGTPIWMGHRSSLAQQVMERLDGTFSEREDGQYPMYNKVTGVIVTGNEDGAHSCAETILFNMSHYGFTVPPNSDTYWVGEAGPGPSYIEKGQDHLYTKRTTRYMVENTLHAARLLQDSPYPIDMDAEDAAATA